MSRPAGSQVRALGGVIELLTRFGPARLAAMGAVTLALVGFFAFVIMRVSQPAMGVLFTDLQGGDASTVVRDLETRGIRYETRDEGGTILVPKADIAKVRMELAGKGLPSGGGVGYEIFDKGDAFSTTSFVQNINHLRALEGELSRTIRTIGRVQSARVHLALPERRLFARDKEAARASIVLKLRGELAGDQVQAIRHLVASAVEGLTAENVSIIDERGRLLANGGQGGGEAGLGAVDSEEKRIGLSHGRRQHGEPVQRRRELDDHARQGQQEGHGHDLGRERNGGRDQDGHAEGGHPDLHVGRPGWQRRRAAGRGIQDRREGRGRERPGRDRLDGAVRGCVGRRRLGRVAGLHGGHRNRSALQGEDDLEPVRGSETAA